MATEEYMEYYKSVFEDDMAFSRNLKRPMINILRNLRFPIAQFIIDNEGTVDDFKGGDLTIKANMTIGCRVRRFEWMKYDQFSKDDKELEKMTCDIYFFGYTTPDKKNLHSWIVFDNKDFEKAYKNGKFDGRIERKKNIHHSKVWFSLFYISDIRQYCTIYGSDGKIGWRNLGLPQENVKLGNFMGQLP